MSNFFKSIGNSIAGFFRRKLDAIKQRYRDFKALSKAEKRRRVGDIILNNAIYIIFTIFIIYVQIYCWAELDKSFISASSIIDLLRKTSYSLFLALGIGGIIVLTGTDLSAGRVLGLTACISAALLQKAFIENPYKLFPDMQPWPIALVILFVMIIGALIGLFNGFFVAKFKMHPFIVTLGSQLIIYGMILIFLNMGTGTGQALAGLSDKYFEFVNGTVSIFGFDIPNYVFFAIIAVALMWFIWNKTTLGKNMYAVGANPDAANVSGVSVFWTTVIIFVMAGALYGFSGFIEGARVASNSAVTGAGAELDAIAACVIGGVSFTGGVGKISGIVLGVFLLNLITVGLQWVGISPDWQNIIKGFIIIFAVAVDMRKYISKK